MQIVIIRNKKMLYSYKVRSISSKKSIRGYHDADGFINADEGIIKEMIFNIPVYSKFMILLDGVFIKECVRMRVVNNNTLTFWFRGTSIIFYEREE